MSTQTKPNKKELTRVKNQTLILDAAEQLFSQLGYDGTSMSMVAKEAGVPKANILYYFKILNYKTKYPLQKLEIKN